MAFITVLGVVNMSTKKIIALQRAIFSECAVPIDRLMGVPDGPVPDLHIFVPFCLGNDTGEVIVVVDGLYGVAGEALFLDGWTRTRVAEEVKKTVGKFFPSEGGVSRIEVHVKPIEVCESQALDGYA
ncbi:MAG: hypothetical protein WC309_01825 [Candidatus Paceibacterota bacterium]